jgi:hypothetical protein
MPRRSRSWPAWRVTARFTAAVALERALRDGVGAGGPKGELERPLHGEESDCQLGIPVPGCDGADLPEGRTMRSVLRWRSSREASVRNRISTVAITAVVTAASMGGRGKCKLDSSHRESIRHACP